MNYKESKTLFLAAVYPPIFGGISDFNKNLDTAFREQNSQVAILRPETLNLEIDKRSNWDGNDFDSVKRFAKDEKCNSLLLSFAPMIFNQKSYGFSFSLIFFILNIRSSMSIKTFVHEANYPFELNLKGILIGLPHIIQFFIIGICSKVLFFSNQKTLDKWKWLSFFGTKVIHRPIFSNFVPSQKIENKNKTKLAHMISLHPSIKTDWVINAFNKLKSIYPDKQYELHIFGRGNPIASTSDIIVHGEVDADAIQTILQDTSFLLSPFDDGVSLRRGSVMMGLAFGCQVLTTPSENKINYDLSDILLVSNENSESSFTDLLVNNIDYEFDNEKIQSFYQKNFSVEVLSREILKFS